MLECVKLMLLFMIYSRISELFNVRFKTIMIESLYMDSVDKFEYTHLNLKKKIFMYQMTDD